MSDSKIIDPNTGQPMDLAGAKPVVGDDELRAKQAAMEIRTILEAYDAELFPTMVLSPRGILGVSVDVLPKSRLNPQQAQAVAGDAPKMEDQVQPDQAAGDDGAAVEEAADAKADDAKEEPEAKEVLPEAKEEK
jgi:hypothetical protein